MKKILLVLLFLPFLALVFWGFTKLWRPEDNWIFQNGERAIGEKPTLANPAAQNCLDKGGKRKTVRETAGELGICQFDDGTECEEWQFYQEQCQKGQLKTADTTHPYSGFIQKAGNGYRLKADTGVEYVLSLASEAGTELKNRLIVEAASNQSVTVVAAETPPLSKTLVLKGFQEK